MYARLEAAAHCGCLEFRRKDECDELIALTEGIGYDPALVNIGMSMLFSLYFRKTQARTRDKIDLICTA